jgi:hypothetical protein
MPRRVIEYTAQHGRDKGKVFVITEMPADQAERWATRALLALANGGAKVPDEVLDAGMAGVAAHMAGVAIVAIRSLQGLSYAAVEDLLDEMMDCVQHKPMGAAGSLAPMPLMKGINCQIEEVRTFFDLRVQVLQAHTDFSLADVLSSFRPTPSELPQAPSA